MLELVSWDTRRLCLSLHRPLGGCRGDLPWALSSPQLHTSHGWAMASPTPVPLSPHPTRAPERLPQGACPHVTSSLPGLGPDTSLFSQDSVYFEECLVLPPSGTAPWLEAASRTDFSEVFYGGLLLSHRGPGVLCLQLTSRADGRR